MNIYIYGWQQHAARTLYADHDLMLFSMCVRSGFVVPLSILEFWLSAQLLLMYTVIYPFCSSTWFPLMLPYWAVVYVFNLGIGYALAKEFLKAGDNVIICSRSGMDLILTCKWI